MPRSNFRRKCAGRHGGNDGRVNRRVIRFEQRRSILRRRSLGQNGAPTG